MKLRILIAALLCVSASAQAETIAIIHAKAWTLTGDTAVEDATIVITDGKIASVSAGASAPAGARVIDAGGKPVTPGLMHPSTRLGLIEVSSANETVDHAAKASAPGAGFDVQFAINANSTLIDLARADGVTRALSYPSSSGTPPFAGSAALLRLFENGDMVEQPHAAVVATIGNRSAMATVGSRSAQWQLLRTALDTAKAAAATPPATGQRTPDALALESVINGKAPLAIATHRESDLRQAIRLASDYRIRVVILGGAEAWRVVDQLAAAKIPVIVDPMSNLPSSFDELGTRIDNAALLRKAGVTVAMSLDGVQSYNAGLSIREGAGLAVANGLPYVDGLRSIISAPAEIWGVADRFGTLSVAKDGDLVIWDGDPLEPSSAPSAVFIQGKEVSLVTRQTELRDRYLPLIRSTGAAGRP